MRRLKEFVLGFVTTLAAFAILQPVALGQEFPHDYRLCFGDYALCAASTCTPTGGQILVNTATGKASFPAATCTCPIFKGEDLVDVAGGNMAGSCRPTSILNVWSGYWPKAMMPQQLSDWQSAASPGLLCGANQDQGSELVNCFSFNCVRAGTINGTEVATCTCPLGEGVDGTPIEPDTAFFTQAGQCSTNYCSQHPVSAPLGFDDLNKDGACIELPPGSGLSTHLLRDDLPAELFRDGGRVEKTTGHNANSKP